MLDIPTGKPERFGEARDQADYVTVECIGHQCVVCTGCTCPCHNHPDPQDKAAARHKAGPLSRMQSMTPETRWQIIYDRSYARTGDSHLATIAANYQYAPGPMMHTSYVAPAEKKKKPAKKRRTLWQWLKGC